MARREDIQKRLGEIEAALRDVEAEKRRHQLTLSMVNTALGIATRAAHGVLHRELQRLMDERSHLQRELTNLGKPKPPVGFELIDAEEAQEEEGHLYLVLTERDTDGEVEGHTDLHRIDPISTRSASIWYDINVPGLRGPKFRSLSDRMRQAAQSLCGSPPSMGHSPRRLDRRGNGIRCGTTMRTYRTSIERHPCSML
ncbi:hypothetical protein [Methylobacterium pseudosasicola]|uniref:Uncharacterized protein n=1 Tax=Methylobacterium pseudosasicola TaxID=582667 RepID=A0A1I4PTI2_9HYPH|nr:hypothetical protein [Methylobacterium pseudosasicola]SFM31064.1 hypothetical protein SAMN05192568_102654 [Methylobacterium pseudosasicola]